jgi:small subunit ribosomal protein S16
MRKSPKIAITGNLRAACARNIKRRVFALDGGSSAFRVWKNIGENRITNQKGKNKMATVIRLARHGAKKRPYYHIVVMDSRSARNSGNVLQVVGKYDPMQPKDGDKRVILKIDEIKAWMGKGAKPSDRVYKFLANAGVLEKKSYPVQTKKHLQSEKTLAKIKNKADKLAKIAEEKAAAEAAANAPAPAVEEAAPEAPAETAAE